MRIGFMLRNLREPGGIQVYTQNLLEELLAIESVHEFVMLYPDSLLVGHFGSRPRVREVVVRFPTRFGWDQLAIPWAARRLNLDLIVNPKLSVPILPGRPTVFTLHGAEQFAVPDQRHDDFAVRCAVAGDVTGEGMNVLNQLHLARLGRDSAHAGAEGNANAGRSPLERAEHQLSIDIPIKADPVDVGQRFPDQAGRIGHIGDAIAFASHEALQGQRQVGVKRGLVRCLNLEVVHQ